MFSTASDFCELSPHVAKQYENRSYVVELQDAEAIEDIGTGNLPASTRVPSEKLRFFARAKSRRHLNQALFQGHFFRAIYLPEDRLSNFPLWEDVSSEGPKAYLGHLGWAFARSARAETATVLRDPIERLLSVYVYASKAMLRQPLIGMDSSQMSLIQFLESTQVGIRQNIDNAQTWQLCHCYHWEQREKLAETSDQTIFRAASENLEKIDWLGVSENLSEFCKRLSMSKIQTEKNAPRRNVSSGRLSYSGLSDREKKAMHKCTEMDVALYEKARHRLACGPR